MDVAIKSLIEMSPYKNANGNLITVQVNQFGFRIQRSADSGFPVILQFNKRQIFLNQENYLNKATPAEQFIVKSINKFVFESKQPTVTAVVCTRSERTKQMEQ